MDLDSLRPHRRRSPGAQQPAPFAKFGDKSRLEDILEHDVSILGLDVLVVGRQVATSYGKRLDLLAIDAGGDLHAIELKRDRTPREVVAQVLDYGSWVKDLGHEDILRSHISDKRVAPEHARAPGLRARRLEQVEDPYR